jgi:anti-sigma regulatory factor (Ser/Thr protein kinase)
MIAFRAMPAAAATYDMTSEPDKLAAMRAWLGLRLAPLGLSAAETTALIVAVGELATNAIKHGYRGRAGEPIRVTCMVEDARVVLEVEDFGCGFDAAAYRGPDVDAMPERGLGIYLARRAVDSLTSEPARASGTRWTLVKRLLPGRTA